MNQAKRKFITKLSFFSYLIVFIYFIYAYVKSGLLIDSYYIGRLTGTLLFLFLLPYIITYYTTKNSKYDNTTSTVVFIISLFLFSFVQLNSLAKQTKETSNNPKHKAEFVANYFEDSAKSKHGLSKKLDMLMSLKMKESMKLYVKWLESFEQIQNIDMYSKIDKEHSINKESILSYIIIVKESNSFLDEFINHFINEFTMEEQNQEIFKAYIAGRNEGLKTRKSILMKQAEAKLAFGELKLELYTIIYSNQQNWDLKEGSITINEPELYQIVMKLQNDIDVNENIIIETSNKISQMSLNE